MNGNSTISKELSARAAARHTAPRWRMVFALVLALSIGSAGQTAPAKAAPHADQAEVYFEVWAFPEKPPPLCIDHELKIYTSVHKGIVKIINDKAYDIPAGEVPTAKVLGSMTNNIGTLSAVDDEVASLTERDADFLFMPKKAGTTTLTFNADVPGVWTGSVKAALLGTTYPAKRGEIHVTVRNCNYKVKTLWEHTDVIYHTVGISDEAVMTSDESGTFTGSGTLYWVYSYVGGPCDLSASATDSQIDLTGKLDDDGGQFVATETFQPYTISTTINCPYTGTSSGESTGTVPPLTFKVASSGGVLTQSLAGGTATIIVVPDESGAGAFNPGNQETHVGPPSPRWAMQWDDFSSLIGVLLALR